VSHNGHMNEHDKKHAVESGLGVLAELGKQGNYLSGQAGNTAYRALTSTHLSHTGAQAVQSLAKYAPAAVVAAGAVAPPLAIAAGVGYGVYKLFKWLTD
jgi:hypothetical protein